MAVAAASDEGLAAVKGELAAQEAQRQQALPQSSDDVTDRGSPDEHSATQLFRDAVRRLASQQKLPPLADDATDQDVLDVASEIIRQQSPYPRPGSTLELIDKVRDRGKELMGERAVRANAKAALEALDRAPDVPPDAGDEVHDDLPPGLGSKGA